VGFMVLLGHYMGEGSFVENQIKAMMAWVFGKSTYLSAAFVLSAQ
jgi:hypothetical protein